MRVLVIADNIQLRDGTGRYSSMALAEYPSLGVEPTILTLKSKGKFKDELNILLPLTTLANFFRNVFLTRKLAKNFEVVHAFDVWPYGVYAYLAVLATKKKLFMNGVGTYSVPPPGFSLKKLFMNLALGRAGRVYCISDYTEKRIRQRFPRAKTEVVYLGLTKMPEATLEFVERVRDKYGLTRRRPVIITVGHIKYRKGQLDTLRAVEGLREKFPDILYLMAGLDDDEFYVGQIKKFARERNFTDSLRIITDASDKELGALYQSSDVFCLNSNKDSHSVFNSGVRNSGLVL